MEGTAASFRSSESLTMNDNDETMSSAENFDFAAFASDTLFHERRKGRDRRAPTNAAQDDGVAPRAPAERRARKERRRRIDPTTFEKQYTEDELEFMNAMQSFKEQSGRSFPTHGEVLQVALSLGYRKLVPVISEGEAELPKDAEGEAELLEDAEPASLADEPSSSLALTPE
jgi:hypothetical protein